ncbi:MAG TPA: RNA polymerase sigma factor [Gemmataceae bacterium]
MLHVEFEKLYQRHYSVVWHKVYARYGDDDIAHDAVQDAYVQLWKSWLSGEKIAHPLAWLCCVAARKARDIVKRKFHRNGTQPPAIMNAIASHVRSVLHGIERREDAEKFQRELESLPADDRELVDMRQALTIAEIAKMKGWSKRQVKRRLAKVRISLRPLLEEYFPSRSQCRCRKAVG